MKFLHPVSYAASLSICLAVSGFLTPQSVIAGPATGDKIDINDAIYTLQKSNYSAGCPTGGKDRYYGKSYEPIGVHYSSPDEATIYLIVTIGKTGEGNCHLYRDGRKSRWLFKAVRLDDGTWLIADEEAWMRIEEAQ
jgi:hypothetical protein